METVDSKVALAKNAGTAYAEKEEAPPPGAPGVEKPAAEKPRASEEIVIEEISIDGMCGVY